MIGMVACACILSACSSGPKVSTEVQRPGASPQAHPTASTPSTSRTTLGSSAPGAVSGGHGSPPAVPGGSPTTTTSSASSGPGPAPNVVGQSLVAAEQRLAAAGYNTAAHPWGGSCSTPNAIMQQVPPAQGSIQLFYCATPS